MENEVKKIIKEQILLAEDNLSDGYEWYGGEKSIDLLVDNIYNAINKPVETTNEKPIEIEELENFPVMCLCGEHTEECCADYCTE